MKYCTRFLLVVATFALLAPQSALAWGAKGHTLINRLAAQTLPADMPAFVRMANASSEIGTLGPEEDRLKGAGESWDADNDPGHYVDVGDDGTIFGVRLNALPPNMNAYEMALLPEHSTPWRAGYLPYSIVDGFEQLREDFAYWRVDDYGTRHARSASLRARFAADRALRETLTVRDLGVWGHFIGDGCQPLHVTVHFNGWGHYPNPHDYTQRHIHSLFESEFVDRFVSVAQVRATMSLRLLPSPAHLLSQDEIGQLTATYLEGSASAVIPLYKIAALRGFEDGSETAIAFTTRQLARGADELRALSDLAWRNSLYAEIGYPKESVRDILNGRAPLSESVLQTV
ncbi:MAG: S1/P1 Nuclease [Candidatus Tyrphobacter sp.]